MKEFLKKEFGITNIEQIEDNWFQFIVTKSWIKMNLVDQSKLKTGGLTPAHTEGEQG